MSSATVGTTSWSGAVPGLSNTRWSLFRNMPRAVIGLLRAASDSWWVIAQRSSHRVVFGDKERRELERRAAAYSGLHSDEVLAEAILFAAEGLSNTDIATRRSQPRRAASRCRNASVRRACRGLRRELGRAGRSASRSPQRAEGKTLACVLPADPGVPPLRWSSAARPETGSRRSMKLVEQFMTQEPYTAARRVFLTADNGSAHRGERAIERLQRAWPSWSLALTAAHARWLNRAEIYFSVAQRKVPQPNNFVDLDGAQQALLAFGRSYEQSAHRFEWRFTRQGLHRLLVRLEQPNPALQLAA
jgi:hypothetical protein